MYSPLCSESSTRYENSTSSKKSPDSTPKQLTQPDRKFAATIGHPSMRFRRARVRRVNTVNAPAAAARARIYRQTIRSF
jgi:hypothetical protein